jgi:transcriptional regulator with XRE-family HTH domain
MSAKNKVRLSAHVGRRLEEERTDADCGQQDVINEMHKITSFSEVVTALEIGVAANLTKFREFQGKRQKDLAADLNKLRDDLHDVGIDTEVSGDVSWMSKVENSDRIMQAVELRLFSIALGVPMEAFFPNKLNALAESNDPFSPYQYLGRSIEGIQKYRHVSDRNKIAVVFCSEGLSFPEGVSKYL